MALSSGVPIDEIDTQVSLAGTSTAAVADTALSVINATTGTDSWTNSQNAITATFVLKYTVGVAGDANKTVNLFARLLNVDGSTGDTEVPTADFRSVYIGRF